MVPPRHMSASYSRIDVRVDGDDTDKITTGELVRFRNCSDTSTRAYVGAFNFKGADQQKNVGG